MCTAVMFAFLKSSLDLSSVNDLFNDDVVIVMYKTSDIILIKIYIAANFTLKL